MDLEQWYAEVVEELRDGHDTNAHRLLQQAIDGIDDKELGLRSEDHVAFLIERACTHSTNGGVQITVREGRKTTIHWFQHGRITSTGGPTVETALERMLEASEPQI